MPLVLGHLDKMRVEIGSQYYHIYMVLRYNKNKIKQLFYDFKFSCCLPLLFLEVMTEMCYETHENKRLTYNSDQMMLPAAQNFDDTKVSI